MACLNKRLSSYLKEKTDKQYAMPLKLFRSFLDFLTPRTCCACGRRLSVDENIFCAACMLKLPFTDFLSHPYDNELAQTFWGKVSHFEKAYALLYHEPHSDSAHIVYQIKYYNKPDTGVDIGTLMGKAMKDSDFLNDIDALLPVPLAKAREHERGFNQSEMIALGIKDATGLPIMDDAVKRTTFNGSQTRKRPYEPSRECGTCLHSCERRQAERQARADH